MDESNPKAAGKQTQGGTTPEPPVKKTDASIALELAFARGSGDLGDVPPPERRAEHSVMEGLPQAKAERIASVYREVAELQRQLSTAQQRIATELQARAEDADRIEALEARVEAQELKTQQDGARVTELETALASVRSQLDNATATADAHIRDRDTQIEELKRKQHQDTAQLESERSSLRETKALLDTRDAELATRTTERDTEQATKSRLERELDDERKAHGDTIATRDRQVSAITAERDSLKTELEKAHGELETGRTRARDLATHLVKFGQELDGVVLAPVPAERPHRSQPPPLPQARSAVPETVLEVTEEPKSGLGGRSVLLLLGGVIVGCAVMFAVLKMSNASSAAAGNGENVGAPPPSALAVPAAAQPASESAAAPTMRDEAAADPTSPTIEITPPPTEGVQQPAAPVENKTEGVILLPEAAAGHRVFVDDRKVDVKDSRAVIPCGKREIRIGSRGTARTIDVACGGETAIPAENR
ncbi:MAG TPA: hypothetical protein VIV11_05705 [Kofleriaceae bacterium]